MLSEPDCFSLQQQRDRREVASLAAEVLHYESDHAHQEKADCAVEGGLETAKRLGVLFLASPAIRRMTL